MCAIALRISSIIQIFRTINYADKAFGLPLKNVVARISSPLNSAHASFGSVISMSDDLFDEIL